MTDYDVVRVFCGPHGGYGNELGVVRNGSVMPGREELQEFAAKLGFSETVFVDDPERGVIDIYTPTLRHVTGLRAGSPRSALQVHPPARNARPLAGGRSA